MKTNKEWNEIIEKGLYLNGDDDNWIIEDWNTERKELIELLRIEHTERVLHDNDYAKETMKDCPVCQLIKRMEVDNDNTILY